MTASFTPPRQPLARVELVDALRGFALLGICLVHCLEHFELYALRPTSSWLHELTSLLFSGKAYAIFAMLFGVSFFIITDRQRQKGLNYRKLFAWRMVLLMGIGYLHTLVYHGDILFVLGLLGLSFLAIDYWQNRTLLIIAAVLALQLPTLVQLFNVWSMPDAVVVKPRHWGMYQDLRAFHGENTSLIAHLLQNGWHGLITKCWYFVEDPRGLQLISLFLCGLVVGRLGFFSRTDIGYRSYLSGISFLLAASVVVFLLRRYSPEIAIALSANPEAVTPLLRTLCNAYLNIAMMGAWVLGFAMLYHWNKTHRLLHLFAPCGRVSLTLYVIQALVCVPLFYPWGLGWYETIAPQQAILFGVSFYAALMIAAHIWVKHFHFGPAEWLWRAATYRTLNVPFRKPLLQSETLATA